MVNRSFSWEKFLEMPVTGILRNISFGDIMEILPLYQAAGMTTIEITMNSPDAENIIRYAVNQHAGHLNIGAGTVCDIADLNRALQAGAQFIVTPLISKEVIRACVRQQIAVFPGALTPSEIHKAWTWGADMVKIFPATSFAPQYIKELKGPLNQIKLMPTGGISLNNCIDFLSAGALGSGIGSQLFDKIGIREKNWKALEKHFSLFVQKIKTYCKNYNCPA